MGSSDKLKDLLAYKKEFEKLNEADIQFANQYPIASLINHALGKVTTDQKEQLEGEFRENIILQGRYDYIKEIINTKNIRSVEQFEKYAKVKGLKP